MKFKKKYVFSSKNRAPCFGARACHPSTLIDFVNTALADRGSVKTTCMIAEVYRTQSVVTGPMNFKKSGRFFPESHAPGCLGHLAAILAF